VSYAVVTYGVIVVGVLAYGAFLERTRRRLERELERLQERNRG
jgi:CcmD family protein